ncbi:MAG TPA: response regulator [Vicinamibacteria bacterium]|nr:response regulator [Vicinamibacteria bacterium]
MPSILIVDHDPASQRFTNEILERAGVVCLLADDLGKAIDIARVHRPDGVLLEIGPFLEGIKAAHTIKADLPQTAVVLLTGHDEETYLSATGKTGADALLPKRDLQHTLLPTLRALGGEFLWIWDRRERRGRWLPSPGLWDGNERRTDR